MRAVTCLNAKLIMCSHTAGASSADLRTGLVSSEPWPPSYCSLWRDAVVLKRGSGFNSRNYSNYCRRLHASYDRLLAISDWGPQDLEFRVWRSQTTCWNDPNWHRIHSANWQGKGLPDNRLTKQIDRVTGVGHKSSRPTDRLTNLDAFVNGWNCT